MPAECCDQPYASLGFADVEDQLLGHESLGCFHEGLGFMSRCDTRIPAVLVALFCVLPVESTTASLLRTLPDCVYQVEGSRGNRTELVIVGQAAGRVNASGSTPVVLDYCRRSNLWRPGCRTVVNRHAVALFRPSRMPL